MSINASITVHVKITTDSGAVIESPTSKTVPVTLALANEEVETRNFKLATAASVNIWEAAESPVDSFGLVYILSDQDVFIEKVVDDDNGAGVETQFAQKISAGIPYTMSSGIAYGSDYVQTVPPADVVTGTLDVIDRLVINNQSGSEANIDVIVGS